MFKDNRIDGYIEKAQPFAKDILIEIRKRIHDFCPDINETMKWSFPHFMLNDKILCSMAAFKQHCSFGFWLASIMNNHDFKQVGMGDLGKMKSIEDLPKIDVFKTMLFEARDLTLAGKSITKKATTKSELIESEEFLIQLKSNKFAFEFYNKLSPSHKKEYNSWILEAKTELTRNKRIKQALEWISEGKARNWKYEKC